MLTVFNNKDDVINAIQSVIAQTFKQWELIIVDDCSTDGSGQIIQKFIKNNATYPIRLIRNKKNMGTYVSKNIGLQVATGKYIATIDSDDMYHPNMLAESVNQLEQNDQCVATIAECQKGQLTGTCPATLVYRKKIIDEIGFYDSVRFSADTEFIDRIRTKYEDRLKKIKKILYYAKIRIVEVYKTI